MRQLSVALRSFVVLAAEAAEAAAATCLAFADRSGSKTPVVLVPGDAGEQVPGDAGGQQR